MASERYDRTVAVAQLLSSRVSSRAGKFIRPFLISCSHMVPEGLDIDSTEFYGGGSNLLLPTMRNLASPCF